MTASGWPTLAFAVPLLAGAVCSGIGTWLPRRAIESIAIATAVFAFVACVLTTSSSTGGILTHWFGGWAPRNGIALGVAFVVDPIGGTLASFAALLTAGALIFAWTYYREGGPPFTALMLVFMSALIGFFFTGDLFNLFVFFELMSVSAYALTGYRSEDDAAVEGALSFAVVNSVGAFFVLFGIALVYARTGALNMAQIAHALGHHADPLVLIAFVLIVCGFLVKSAVVPFHFWLADAHAVAPTPLCALFSGIMVQAGLYAVARCYWTVFATVLAPDARAVQAILLALGVATAITGGAMALMQSHIKRLLAFSTVAHSGILLAAIALLDGRALGGFATYVVGHGFLKAGLFMCSGLLLARFGSLDANELRCRLRREWWVGLAFAVGALGLAGMPPFGTFIGSTLIGARAEALGMPLLPWVLAFPAALTGAAVLGVSAKITLGWGPRPNASAGTPKREAPEAEEADRSTPFVMFGTAVAAIAGSAAIFVVPNIAAVAEAAGRIFADHAAQLAVPLAQAHAGVLIAGPAVDLTSGLTVAVASTAAAIAIAAIAINADRLPQVVRRPLAVAAPIAGGLRRLHSGMVTDYVAWLVTGVATIGTALLCAAIGK